MQQKTTARGAGVRPATKKTKKTVATSTGKAFAPKTDPQPPPIDPDPPRQDAIRRRAKKISTGLKGLFGTPGSTYVPPPPPPPPPPPNPTVESVFGPDPYYKDPTGIFGLASVLAHYSPIYFATEAAAKTLADIYGGTAFPSYNGNGKLYLTGLNQPQWWVRFPNGNAINAGFAISQFGYNHSWDEVDATIREMIASFPEA